MELHRKYGTDQYEQGKCGKIEFRREEQLNLNLFLSYFTKFCVLPEENFITE